MPEVLEFELVQRESLWMSLFGNYAPDNRDIGLYLFPSTCQRLVFIARVIMERPKFSSFLMVDL